MRARWFDVRTGHQPLTDISSRRRLPRRDQPRLLSSSALVLATGGLSIPQMGATGFAYEVARRVGLGCTEQTAGCCADGHRMRRRVSTSFFPGISLEAIVILRATELPREHLVHSQRALGSGILQSHLLATRGYDLARLGAGNRRANGFLMERKHRVQEPKTRCSPAFARPPRPHAWRGMLADWADGKCP